MRVLVIAVLTWSIGGCLSAPPFANAQPSRHALALSVLDALARRDVETLRALALNEAEFQTHVWPGLPAARPERNLPFSYVWGDLHQKSEASLQALAAAHGGRRYELIELRFSGQPQRYPGYQIHRDPVFVVGQNGVPAELRLTGSVIEMKGSWKVFSYAVD
jgi:hypothetical protein